MSVLSVGNLSLSVTLELFLLLTEGQGELERAWVSVESKLVSNDDKF